MTSYQTRNPVTAGLLLLGRIDLDTCSDSNQPLNKSKTDGATTIRRLDTL